jgi:lipopolysaccharide transport system permease protein
VAATFLMHMAGYGAVLVVLQLLGTPLYWPGLLAALPLLALLCLFAASLALCASALQVFVRDVGQILPPLMTFWFFTTPILYSAEALPQGLAAVMRFNPMAWYADRLRDFLLFGDFTLGLADLVVPLLTLALFPLALAFFRRFSTHFEDFL